jgi:DNA repair protein RecN (Recombination protein N)
VAIFLKIHKEVMIRELHIKNLALIEDVHVEFSGGFSVFTGETGAGKSILVGAIGLLLGERASAEQVRSGFDEAEVSGVFELGAMRKPLADILSQNSIGVEGGACIVRRVIARSGKNRVYINQVPVPLSVLKTVGDNLVDFHGQHEHQSLLDPQNAQRTIDRLPGVEKPAAEFAVRFAAYVTARDALAEHDRRCADLAAKRDVLEYQYNEFKTLGLSAGEEAKLEAELALVSTSAQRIECVSKINDILSSDETSISRQIGIIRKNLELLGRYDTSALPWLNDLQAPSAVFSALEAFCGEYLEKSGAAVSPEQLDAINSRLAKIQRLKKKYACDFDGLLAKELALKADLDALVNTEADRGVLAAKEKAALDECVRAGRALTAARKKQGAIFDKDITGQMAKLGFTGGEWKTAFAPREAPQAGGLEDAQFMVRTNPGEPLLPLVKIASGGEISRLMLAIKTVLSAHDSIPILVFDEIDSGIGGVLAKEVARALAALSATHQVLCISHLHQIASLADHHYHVYKDAQARRTVTMVKKLSDKEKVAEIARMLGGESEISKKHAEELLKKK